MLRDSSTRCSPRRRKSPARCGMQSRAPFAKSMRRPSRHWRSFHALLQGVSKAMVKLQCAVWWIGMWRLALASRGPRRSNRLPPPVDADAAADASQQGGVRPTVTVRLEPPRPEWLVRSARPRRERRRAGSHVAERRRRWREADQLLFEQKMAPSKIGRIVKMPKLSVVFPPNARQHTPDHTEHPAGGYPGRTGNTWPWQRPSRSPPPWSRLPQMASCSSAASSRRIQSLHHP